MTLSPFHLAIPVHDLAAARTFYGEAFGCAEGRSSEHWVDFDFFGHQLVIHEAPKMPHQEAAHSNPVDGHDQVGEQATMFLLDPCGNALEFKAFKDMSQLFAK